jgi:hypothetical protein
LPQQKRLKSNAAVVIVTGPPFSGETTPGRTLAMRMNMPFLYKDGIKCA